MFLAMTCNQGGQCLHIHLFGSIIIGEVLLNKHYGLYLPIGIQCIKRRTQVQIILGRIVHMLHIRDFELIIAVRCQFFHILAFRVFTFLKIHFSSVQFFTLRCIGFTMGNMLFYTVLDIAFAIEHRVGSDKFTVQNKFTYRTVKIVKLVVVYA